MRICATGVFGSPRLSSPNSPAVIGGEADFPLVSAMPFFPEDVAALRGFQADIMVSHEAPSYHLHGFVGIDAAAELCRARLIIHGHHHESYEAVLPSGTRVRGLAIAEVLRLRPEDLG